MFQRIVFLFLFMFFSNFANAIDENGMFSQAAQLTQQGNYSEAEKIYKKLLNGSSPQRAATMLGTIAEEQRKYPEAIKWYEKSGDSIARFNLAAMYLEGKGVEQDYDKAVKLYLPLVQENFPYAKHYLGRLYLEGLGVPLDVNKAIQLLTEASDVVDKAGYDLGQIYKEGYKVPISSEKSSKFFRKSCKLGYQLACQEYDMNIKKMAKMIGVSEETLKYMDNKEN